ncbi:bifunctional N(6)-L-threonylcarbamoyladenine synthase/serine/threonine protein kinase [Halocatena pleomorpha]|uniref:Probable bifunctional tRNA threonylcarbamoyladenosine biosynthesis protein n=1 Tax=Halocatena pleomorpha TaxID=1785090 RepID=A0A3P3RHK4_9EURY|nr:bifunctional N(6)-L-threonylcarbamoyladenine synthase/serine/threonine protein kinase [Halocatena pleomorpha]RRJ32814.1 bifunctional N(6)-L-threonylcarbamoyladenine synthase/serine/threonine protein kinase [Halocatena pleomorpha]
MRVLGIEGTAWAASAAVYDSTAETVSIFTDEYQPESGGIHPREAAEHMREAIPEVVGRARDSTDEIDVVAFSRGPGLGPCLRIVGTAGRALAGTLDVPLVGVNHMLAHLEIGRHRSGFDAPVCLNASGANAHILGYHNGRYRVLGETMDTGVGNAIDKFTRHVGWSHPGGPKVEAAAADGEYADLPYVVKGMDFSFSGIMSAAKEAYDDGVAIEDVCFSLQETIFAMLAEVSERALSLTGADELVLGGGVGQNGRLRDMLETMCAARGASFYAPEPRFLRDNAGMIAVLGAKMAAAGDDIPIEESRVRPNFRPDEVPVTWRTGSDRRPTETTSAVTDDPQRGAEATVEIDDGNVIKTRVPKAYRHPQLDERLRRERTRAEARVTSDARRLGVSTPALRDIDEREPRIVFEHVGTADLRDDPTEAQVRDVGRLLATLHAADIVHGDPTTRNVRVGNRTWLIDFGLAYYSEAIEDHAMDLHVFSQSIAGTASTPDPLLGAFEESYRDAGDPAVIDQLRTIEGRGRYQS